MTADSNREEPEDPFSDDAISQAGEPGETEWPKYYGEFVPFTKSDTSDQQEDTELVFEPRKKAGRVSSSSENPQDPIPSGANGDANGIRELFEIWTGVPIPSKAEMLSYTLEMKAHSGEARHHLSFSVGTEEAESLLRRIADSENPRYWEAHRMNADFSVVVEPSSDHVIKFAKFTSYFVNLQPRSHRDDALCLRIDLATGQVYCHRWDD